MMCELMQCHSEEQFNEMYEVVVDKFKDVPSVIALLEKSWCGTTCNWRRMWPKFGRLFSYGNVDTNNIVERHWQYIKYTALRGRINRSITCLLQTLIGDSVSGSCIGGTVIEWYKQKQAICESGRFIPRANCREQRIRYKEAETILERYVKNKDTLVILNDIRLLFSIQSMSHVDVWYTVSIQCNYCDCPDVATKCKHLQGILMIIESHMPDLMESLPIIQHAREMHFDDIQYNGDYNNAENHGLKTLEVDVHKNITVLQEALISLERNIHVLGYDDMYNIKGKMDELIITLHGFFLPLVIKMPTSGTIKMQQQNVGLNRLGKRKLRSDIVVQNDDILGSSPPKNRRTGGVMQKIGDKSRKRIRFPQKVRIRCAHCDCNNLIMADETRFYCAHYEALLPFGKQFSDSHNMTSILKGKKVMFDKDNINLMAGKIMDVDFPLNASEMIYNIGSDEGACFKEVYASKTRIIIT